MSRRSQTRAERVAEGERAKAAIALLLKRAQERDKAGKAPPRLDTRGLGLRIGQGLVGFMVQGFEAGRVPSFEEIVEHSAKLAGGTILYEINEAMNEDDEQAPDTERTPFVDTTGKEV